MRRFLLAATLVALLYPMTAVAQSDDADRFGMLSQRYHRLLTQRPRHGTAFDLLYRHYLDAGKLSELVAHYEQLLADEPRSTAARMMFGLVCERRGRLEEALEAFHEAAGLAEDDFYPQYAKAMLLVRLHRQEEAIEAFERVMTKNPDRVQLLHASKTLGRLHLWQGDRDAALAVWSKLAKAFPDDRFALEELAELLAEEEQFDEAIQRYEQLAELAGSDLYRQLTLRVEIGQIQVRQGKLQTAIESFESCLDRLEPDSWNARDIRRRIEEIFIRGDDLTGLAEYYRERLKKHPEDLASMTHLASTLVRLGQSDAALEQYRTAVKLAPSRSDIRKELIDELTQREDFAAAIEQTETLLEQDAGNTEHIERLGNLYLRSTASDRDAMEVKALAVWKRIAEVKPEDPLAAVRVAELCRSAAGIGSRMTGSEDPNKYERQAGTAFGKAALEYYTEAVGRLSDVPQYHEYLGEYLYAVGRVEEALAAWHRLAEPPNDSVANLARLAEILASAGRLDEAVEVASRAVAKESDRYDLHKLAADLLIRNEQFDAALESVAAMERVADSPFFKEQALRRQVETYSAAGRIAEEAEKLSKRIEAGGAGARDYWLAAMLAAAERRSTVALAHLEQALKMQPDDTRLLRFKAEVHQQGGDLAGAAEQYRRLAELEPKNQTAHLKEVVSLEISLGRTEAAIEAARKIVSLSPGNAEAAQLLADAHFRGGQDEEALDVLRRALRASSRNAEVRLLLARRLLERQQIDEAIEHFWRAFEVSENFESKLGVVGDLAEQYVITDRLPELIERLESLRRDQEDTRGATLYLAEAHIRAEDYVSARRELNALAARRPDDVQVLSLLVALSERLGDTEAAIQYQEQVAELSPVTSSLDRLAGLYSDAGQQEKAKEIWLKLVRQAKDDKAIISALDRALREGEFDQALVLAEPEWAKRPDDWRFGYRLARAYWMAEQKDKACGVCQSLQALLPSTKYEKEATAATQGQTAQVSYRRQYPRALMRISLPSEIRSMLTTSASRPYGYSGWQPTELLDAQMFSAVMLYETARAEKKQEAHLDELRERSQTDFGALQQLTWLLFSERNADVRPLLEKWIAENPDDEEPRVGLFYLPFMSVRGPGEMGNVAEHLDAIKPQFDWFVKNRPQLSTFLAGAYVQLLVMADKKDEAIALAKTAVAAAQSMPELLQVGSMLAQLGDSELLALLITRLEQLQSRPGSSAGMGYMNVGSLVQRYAQLAMKEKNWDKLLESFDRYMTVSHPKVIRPGRASAASGHGSPYGPTMTYSSSQSRSDRVGEFPGPSAWLDGGRLQMLQSTHNALRSVDQTERLIQLVQERVEQAEGVPRQCWALAGIVLLWLEDNREEAIQHLENFAQNAPGNVDVRMLLARAYSKMGDDEKALAAIQNTHLPFGTLAKSLEQMRMELAMRADDEEAGKQAALRLFGMRLAANEQTELATVMRRYGLAARSEELIKRAVRTASNSPSDLYQLMQQNLSSNLDRAVEIARMIIRQTKQGAGPNDSDSHYRLEAFRTLKRVGELDELVKKAEQQLAAAPKSTKLMEELAEYYTANGDNLKAEEMVDRLLTVRPDDANLHLSVAQSLFRQNEFDKGVQRLATVWEKDPQLVLRNGYEFGRHYSRANRLDLLAEHLAKAKDHPSLAQQGYQVSNIVQNLQHNTNDVDGLIKVYRVAVDVTPPDYKDNVIREFGQFLVSKKRKDEAYQLYKEQLLPKPEEKGSPPSTGSRSGMYYVNGNLFTAAIQLADLAVETGKSDELAKEMEEAAAKHPDWKPAGELLAAMLSRRADDEKPLEEIGKRYLNDEKFAQSLAQHYSTLRDELGNCRTQSALRTALDVWKKGQARTPGGAVYYSGSASDETRIAGIHMKLDEPDEARQVLLKALEADSAMGMYYGGNLAEQTFQRQVPIADALRTHGFLLDAVAVYCEALQKVPELERDSHVRRSQAPAASRSLSESIAKLIAEKGEETLDLLIAELGEDEPDLARFFAVADPPVQDENSPYSSQSPAPKTAESVATAKAQLLPAILSQPNAADKRDEIKKLVDESLAQLGEETSALGNRLTALSILTAACSGQPDQALQPLQKWIERATEKQALAAGPETWLLALAALENEPTRQVGRQLAFEVAKAAARRGDAARQSAATTAITTSGGDAQAMIDQILTAGRGDPQTYYQIAETYYKQKQYVKAVEALDALWQRAPELAMPKLRELADYYVKADKLDALAKSLRSVRDTNVRNRYAYEIGRLIDSLPKEHKYAEHVLEIYFAWLEFNTNQSSSYEASQLSNYLRGLPQDEKTLDVYRRLVFPDKQREDQFGSLVNPMIDLAQSVKAIDALKSDCRRAMQEHSQWRAKGELLLAVLEQRLGDDKPLVDLAAKYQSDASFAARLSDQSSLLQREMARCEGRPAVELAVQLWKPQLAGEQSGSTSATVQVAQLLIKLDLRQEARQTLLARLEKPFIIDYNTDEDYLLRMKLQEKQQLGQALSQHGFKLDALKAYSLALAIDAGAASANSSTLSVVRQMRDAGRKLVDQIAGDDLGQTLSEFETVLAQEISGDAIAPFLVVLDQTATGQSEKEPDSKLADSIMPLLLDHAKQNDRLSELQQATANARQRNPEDHRLVAIGALIQLQAGQIEAASKDLRLLADKVAQSPQTADDAVWLVAREAIKADETYQLAQTLTEAVANNAGNTENRPRQEAAVLALTESLTATGQSDRAAELMRELIVGEGDKPEDLLQLAKVYFGQDQGAKAVQALASVWEKRPDLPLARFNELATQYSGAGMIDKLCEALEGVTDQDMKNRYSHEVISAGRDLGNDKSRVEEAVKLMKAAVEFAPSGNREYALSTLASYLSQQGRKQEAWEAYHDAVIPPGGSDNRLSSQTASLIRLSEELDKLDEVEQACLEAVKSHPKWQPCADALLAIAKLRTEEDQQPLVTVAERYLADTTYAEPLKNSASVLRSEFDKLDAEPALKVALEMWEVQIAQIRSGNYSSSSSHTYYAAYADVLVKLGRSEEARDVLLEGVNAPMPGYSESYLEYYFFQRREHVAPKLVEAGYPFDALDLYAKNLALEGTEIAEQRRLDRRMPDQRKGLRKAVLQTLAGHLDRALDALQEELAASPPQLDASFTVVTPSWEKAEALQIPEHVRSEPVGQIQLLPAILKQAESKGQLESLGTALAAARSSHPEHELLAALEIFFNQANGDDDVVPALVKLSRQADGNVRALAVAGLSKFSSKEATEAIIAAATDSHGRLLAVNALQSQDSPEAAEILGKWLSDVDPALRMQAQQALLRMSIPEAKSLCRFETLLRDEFDGQPTLDWQIERSVPQYVSCEKQPGMLTIRTHNSGFSQGRADHQNVFLLANPLPGEDFRVTVCVVGFTPSQPYEQAALLIWNDADNYLKLSYECGSVEKPRLTVIPENSGEFGDRADLPVTETSDRTWLRLTRQNDLYQYASSTDGETFQGHGTITWGNGDPKFLGLAAIAPGNPAPPEVDLSFDFFHVERPVGSAVVRPMDLPILEVTGQLEDKPDDSALWFRRAGLYAGRGRWQEAADDYAKGIELSPEDHWNWYISGALQLLLGNKAQYDRICGEMLSRFGQTDQANIAERVAKICLMSPEPVETDLPLRLAEQAVSGNSDSGIYYWFLLAKGIGDYRTGQFQQAIESLEACRQRCPENQGYCRALDLLYLAMANHKLGKGDVAQREYQAALELMAGFAKPGGPTIISGWNDWVLAEVARKEAETLLGASQ